MPRRFSLGRASHGEVLDGIHPHRRARRAHRRGQDHARRGAARQGGRDRRRREAWSAATRSAISISLEKEYRHSLNSAIVNLAWKGDARPPDRHAGLARFHGAGDRRARRGRDRGGRDQRRDRRAARHRPHAQVGGEAQPVPHDRDQPHRRGERRSSEAMLAKIQQAVGKECLPINLPAKNAHRRGRLLLQSRGESDFPRSRRRTRRWSTRWWRSTRS